MSIRIQGRTYLYRSEDAARAIIHIHIHIPRCMHLRCETAEASLPIETNLARQIMMTRKFEAANLRAQSVVTPLAPNR